MCSFESVAPVVGVYLYTGFGGVHLHGASADWLYDACGKGEFVGLITRRSLVKIQPPQFWSVGLVGLLCGVAQNEAFTLV